MRRFLSALLVVLLACGPVLLHAAPAHAQTVTEPAPPAVAPMVPETAAVPPSADYLPLVVGLGAIAGVVGFNLVALGVGSIPGGAAYAAGMMVPAEMSVAMSRVYAVSSAVAGAWIAHYLYSAE
ncbi:hypothetical protein [Azospirillum halopraeferens]|uniref:hypothetical protein n=1 Tax=Azospirillum halopraeferens TaxID=34010 RepID=UPI000420897E|nr:hypothetical protein [Azospirillum halopraeferens]